MKQGEGGKPEQRTKKGRSRKKKDTMEAKSEPTEGATIRDVLEWADEVDPRGADEGFGYAGRRELWLQMAVGDDLVALPAHLVDSVRVVPEITPVPLAAAEILGVAAARGRVFVVVDLRRRLGADSLSPNERHRLLLVRWQGRLVGLLAEERPQTISLEVEKIEEPPAEAGEYCSGVYPAEGRHIFLLDTDLLFAVGADDSGPRQDMVTAG